MGPYKRLLVVARWPLGGIRTYMRYVYAHLGADWEVTILAADVQESVALRADAAILGADLILAPATPVGFFKAVWTALATGRHGVIQSQGFISAITVCLANFFYRRPHVLTVHGIIEDRLLQGWQGRIKRSITGWAIRSVDVIYAVSQDILEHVRQQVPGLSEIKPKQVAILNGIEPGLFLEEGCHGAFRQRHGLPEECFLFGFLGRFMPQKGFDKIVEALSVLEERNLSQDYRLVAIGSGDYRAEYERLVQDKGLAGRVFFLPFQRDVAEIYRDLDTVVMPSRWEACPLQPMEALVSGVPVIASDCIGLREVVRDTPARMVPGGDPHGLAAAMEEAMRGELRQEANAFRREAAERFDVRSTAQAVRQLMDGYAMENRE